MNVRHAQIVGAGALGGGGVAALVALLGGQSIWTVIAVLCALVGVAAALFAVRSLRMRLAVSERRWRELRSQHDALTARVSPSASSRGEGAKADPQDLWADLTLAVAQVELQAVPGPSHIGTRGGATAGLPAATLAAAVLRAVERGDVLFGDHLVRRYDVTAALPLRTLRLLARGLRDRGYLARAGEYFAAAAAIGDERDRTTAELRRSEIEVMAGTVRPVVTATDPVVPTSHRVLHVVGRAVPTTQSGYTLRTHSTVRAQLDQGLEPHVFVQLGVTEAEVASTDVLDGVTYHRPVGRSVFTAGHGAWLQANAEALLAVVQEVRPAVLHAHSDFFNALIASAVGAATGLPVVYEARGFWEESWLSRTADKFGWDDVERLFAQYGAPEAYSWRQAREAEARGAAAHVVTLARVMARRILDHGLDQDRLTIVPNAVDGEQFSIGERDHRLAAELGVPAGTVVLGCITSVVEYEGIDVLLEALALLAEADDPVPLRLLVVGDGPVRSALQEQASALGLDNVTFTGRVPHEDVLGYYSLIDVFVVPRRPARVCHLVTPLKPFEAFAAGRAVVMSDVEALREIAEDSGAADLFTAGDPRSLADTLDGLARDPERRERLAAQGAAWVRAERSWTGNAEQYRRLYAQVGGSHG
jgi:glycosyltransferase involved in cell wall biosynthesis